MSRENLLKLRRGAAATWSNANPVLAAGEPGVETDTNKLKIGDGTTAWNSLSYFAVDGGDLDVTNLSLNGIFTFGGTTINLSDHFDSGTPTSFAGQTDDTLIVPE